MRAIGKTLLAAALMVAGLVPGVAAAERTLKFAHVLQTDHPYHKMALKFKDALEAKNVGLKVTIYPASQLGNESTLVEGLQIGSVDMATITSAVTSNFVPEFEIFSLPFIFKDADHLYRVMDGPEGDALAVKLKDAGLVKLGYGYGGTRDLYTHDPVEKLSDLKGMKIRTMKTNAIVDTWNTLGAIATPIAWPEMPVSLKQRLIDGGEGTGVSYRSTSLYKDAPNFTRIAYIFSWHNFMMSKKTFDSLTPEQQKAVLEAGKVAETYERQEFQAQEAALLDDLKTKGVKIIEVQDRPAWVAAVAPVYERNADKVGGMDRIKKIMAE